MIITCHKHISFTSHNNFVLSPPYLAVDLVGRQSPARYKVHTEPDIPGARGHPHILAGGSPDTQAEAAHKEGPCEVAG